MSKTNRLPAYLHIKQDILAKIHQGDWVVGCAIPSEVALAEHFGVSRMTVNRALKELTDERVLDRRQGSGTFVAQQKFNHTFIEVRNIATDIRATGKSYQAQVLGVNAWLYDDLISPLHPRHHLVKEFDLADKMGEVVIFEVKILHLADGKPLQYEERWVNAGLLPSFIEQDFTVVNTSDYLIDNLPLENADYTISAINADADIAQALSIGVHDASLLLYRRTYSRGQVASVVNMWHAGDGYCFSGNLSS